MARRDVGSYNVEGCKRLLIAVLKRAYQDKDDPLRRLEAKAFLLSPVVEAIGEDLGISPRAIRASVAASF